MQTTYFKALYTHRDLLFTWTMRTIRARYQQSILGGLWAILQPVALVAMFSLVFSLIVPVDTGKLPYVVFSYTAMVPWALFATSVTDMVDSLVVNMALVSKIYFPREILPIAVLLARLLDFGIAGGVLVVLLLYYRMPIFSLGLVYLPLVLTIQLGLTLGLGLAGSALNAFYRDVRHLFALGMQIWFYATPVIYPASLVPERLRPFYFLNPMAGLIEAYRAILLDQRLPDSYLLTSALTALVVFLIGYWIFKRFEFQFADVV